MFNKGKNIIFISTLSVYSPLPTCLYIRKKTTENPIGFYGKTKFECEQKLIKAFLKKVVIS